MKFAISKEVVIGRCWVGLGWVGWLKERENDKKIEREREREEVEVEGGEGLMRGTEQR